MSSRDSDCLHRFVFEHTDVRGELVHLDASWQAVLERQTYPEPLRKLLGEAMAAAALLSATIKINGSLHLQLQGDGPVSLVLVEVTAQHTMRGLAHWTGEVPETGLREQVGQARLMLTIDPGEGGERYQGMVAVEQDLLQSTLEDYFAQSEQLATRLWLTANDQRACGMLLQQLPGQSDDDEDWNRDVFLGETVSDDELLELSVTDLLHRLYYEEDLRLFEPEPFSFRCACSAETER
ncbi:MAG: Hsp33 family molecular chaperone HslO, partial [Gammaproteobacteria bacterium]|nr:Hsp33 family molecular chaperone HslO [Gammaproteobacteria bacterium]